MASDDAIIPSAQTATITTTNENYDDKYVNLTASSPPVTTGSSPMTAAVVVDLEADPPITKDDSFSLPPPKPWFVAAAAGTTLIAGLMCVLAVKLQNRTSYPVCDGCEEEYFDQPYWQTFIMFCGESLCLIVWWIEIKLRNRSGRKLMYIEFPNTEASFNKPRTPIWWWIFPGLLDLIGTAFVNMAFTMSYASTIQMLRNTMLICTSFFSIVMMRRPLRAHEMGGIAIMTAGMVVAGIQAIRNPESATNIDEDKAWLGVVLTLVGTVFNAFQLILEEWYFKRAYFPPMGCMGLQGIFGVAMNVLAIGIAHWTGISNIKHGWYQMNRATNIMIGNFWYLIVVFIFNAGSICTTKLGSGLLRAVIYSLRSPILWVIELCLSWQDYAWEQLVALILAAVGFFIYAFILPGINKRSTPKLYKNLKYQVPCFCTRNVPDEDDDELELVDGGVKEPQHAGPEP